MDNLLPSEIVKIFDKYVYGQDDAKRMLAVALRNRWRFNQLPPKDRIASAKQNVLFSGPTGSGKTELLRVLARHFQLPVLEFDLTDFTETGYKGRDVTTIANELSTAIKTVELPKWYTENKAEVPNSFDVEKAVSLFTDYGEEEVVKLCGGEKAYRELLAYILRTIITASGSELSVPLIELCKYTPCMKFTDNNTFVEFMHELADPEETDVEMIQEMSLVGACVFRNKKASHVDWIEEVSLLYKNEDLFDIEEIKFYPEVLNTIGFHRAFKLMYERFKDAPSEFMADCKELSFGVNGLLYCDDTPRDEDGEIVGGTAQSFIEQYAVVFLDEFDKIGSRPDSNGKDVTGLGVQRSLLKIVEGGEYSGVNTEGVLFVAAGAFAAYDIKSIMPELRGRFPLRAALKPLDKDAYRHICKLTSSAFMVECCLLRVDAVDVIYDDDTFDYVAEVAEKLNGVEYLGARRLSGIISEITMPASFNPEKYRATGFDIRGETLRKNKPHV